MKAIRVSPRSRAASAEEMRRSPNSLRTAVSIRSWRRRSRALSSRAASETGMSISIFTATPIIQVVDETEDAEASHFNAKPRASKRRPHLLETEGIENRRFRVLAGIRLGRRGWAFKSLTQAASSRFFPTYKRATPERPAGRALCAASYKARSKPNLLSVVDSQLAEGT